MWSNIQPSSDFLKASQCQVNHIIRIGGTSNTRRNHQCHCKVSHNARENYDQRCVEAFETHIQDWGDAYEVRVKAINAKDHEKKWQIVPYDFDCDTQVADVWYEQYVQDTGKELEIQLVLAWFYKNDNHKEGR